MLQKMWIAVMADYPAKKCTFRNALIIRLQFRDTIIRFIKNAGFCIHVLFVYCPAGLFEFAIVFLDKPLGYISIMVFRRQTHHRVEISKIIYPTAAFQW